MNTRSTLSCSLFTITPHIPFSVSSQLDCGSGNPPQDFIAAVLNARSRPYKYSGQRETLSPYAYCRDRLAMWYLNPSLLLSLPLLQMGAQRGSTSLSILRRLNSQKNSLMRGGQMRSSRMGTSKPRPVRPIMLVAEAQTAWLECIVIPAHIPDRIY